MIDLTPTIEFYNRYRWLLKHLNDFRQHCAITNYTFVSAVVLVIVHPDTTQTETFEQGNFTVHIIHDVHTPLGSVYIILRSFMREIENEETNEIELIEVHNAYVQYMPFETEITRTADKTEYQLSTKMRFVLEQPQLAMVTEWGKS